MSPYPKRTSSGHCDDHHMWGHSYRIHKTVVHNRFESSITNTSAVEKKLPKGLMMGQFTNEPVISSTISGTMAAGIYKSLHFMVEQATAALIRQPPSEFTGLSFEASHKEITTSKHTKQELAHLQPVKNEYHPDSRQQDFRAGSLQTKPRSCKFGSQRWTSFREGIRCSRRML